MDIRIATRKSALALWQTEHVAARLKQLPEVDTVEIVPMSTRGDEILDRSLQKIGGKGLFIKELEVSMAAGHSDIAVHSMKDVPAIMPDGFTLAAVLERANPFDALVSTRADSLSALPERARVGSSSLRRQAQLLARRPDVTVEPLRGNVNTRLAKLDDGEFDAILLACAGLERLNMHDRIAAQIAPDEIMPASAQGVIGIECLSARDDLIALLQQLEDPTSKCTTLAERAVARRLDASCQSPVASYATLTDGTLSLSALVASPDGGEIIRDTASGPAEDADQLGIAIAERLLEQGAGRYLGDNEQ